MGAGQRSLASRQSSHCKIPDVNDAPRLDDPIAVDFNAARAIDTRSSPNERIMSNPMDALPKRWVQVKKALEDDDWTLDRISGSHHIFTKRGARCIPLAVHGGTISPHYADRVLRQAGLRHSDGQDIHDGESELHSFDTCTANAVMSMTDKPPRGEKRLQLETEPRRPIKSVQAKEKDYVRKAELLREQLQQLELQRDQTLRAAESQRIELLEQVQELIAAGVFETAIELTSFIEDVDDFGSSSCVWQFNCDILFYRTVALSEHALLVYSFNSEKQRDEIEHSLSLLSRFMEASLERREDTRDFASSLQKRIVREYTNGLSRLFDRYAYVDAAVRFSGESMPEMVKRMFAGMENTPATPEEGKRLMDEVVVAFEFIVSVSHGRKISLFSAIGEDHLSVISSLVTVCVRKMLVSFDMGDYDTVTRLSETIVLVAHEQRENFRIMRIAMAPFAFASQGSMTSSELLLGIVAHIRALVPVYQYANDSLNWNRLAGVIAEVAELSDCFAQVINFETILTFLDRLALAINATKQHLELLVVSNQTRRFILDTFSDPVLLAKAALEKVIIANEHVSAKLWPVLKEFGRQWKNDPTVDLDSFIMRKPEFQKSRYDKVRVQTTRLCFSVLQISSLYDTLLEVDVAGKKATLANNKVFVKARYEMLPEVLGYLSLLMKFLFGPGNETVALLHQTIVMNNDLDVFDNYFVELGDGKTVGQTAAAGLMKTPEAAWAAGIWSLSLSFNCLMKPFLYWFAIDDELKRLFVIDRISSSHLFSEYPMTRKNERVEALAFALVVKLDAVSDSLPNSADVEKLIVAVLGDSANHAWCHNFVTEAGRNRWAKSKSKRFAKLIGRLSQGLGGVSLTEALSQREASVQYLIGKLQDSVQCARKLPPSLRQSIIESSSQEKMVHACTTYLKDWTREELHLIRQNMIRLEETSEQVTGYFSNATGQAFPQVLAITSPRWTMAHHTMIANETYSVESCNAIRDLKYVHAILTQLFQQTLEVTASYSYS